MSYNGIIGSGQVSNGQDWAVLGQNFSTMVSEVFCSGLIAELSEVVKVMKYFES